MNLYIIPIWLESRSVLIIYVYEDEDVKTLIESLKQIKRLSYIKGDRYVRK